ncbi:MAG: 1-acyl-sn-glycerol-3-phosphate acyltransferase [Ignavibacteria bacterium]|nr:1-acyl-sn-glycerol-3-phosphate acyltransferase [Ignavibacteria bacterium]
MRTLFVITAIVFITTCYAVTIIIHIFLFRDNSVFFFYTKSWGRILLRLSGVKLQVVGEHNIEPGKRYVYVANHSSLFDIPIVFAGIPDNVRIMYKRELERIPVFGWCLNMSPLISVNRSRHRDAADVLANIVTSLSSGASVLLFPEGTRSVDGTVGTFRRGAVTIASDSQTPVIPVSIIGASRVLPARSKRIRGGVVKVIIGVPVQIDAEISRANERDVTNKLRDIISANVNSQHDE